MCMNGNLSGCYVINVFNSTHVETFTLVPVYYWSEVQSMAAPTPF